MSKNVCRAENKWLASCKLYLFICGVSLEWFSSTCYQVRSFFSIRRLITLENTEIKWFITTEDALEYSLLSQLVGVLVDSRFSLLSSACFQMMKNIDIGKRSILRNTFPLIDRVFATGVIANRVGVCLLMITRFRNDGSLPELKHYFRFLFRCSSQSSTVVVLVFLRLSEKPRYLIVRHLFLLSAQLVLSLLLNDS